MASIDRDVGKASAAVVREATMFGLGATDPGWFDRVARHLDTLLLEQAHLERKAAMSALTLTFRYPIPELQQPLAELAREELEHFEQVLSLMARRGIAYGPIQPGPYPAALQAVVRPVEPDRMLDSLLCAAIIEARSCERLRLLGNGLCASDPELSAFYLGLVASEARHHGLYLRLARARFRTDVVAARLDQLLAYEAEIVQQAPATPRLHN